MESRHGFVPTAIPKGWLGFSKLRPQSNELEIEWESDMSWYLCYALGVVVTVCLFVYFAGTVSRKLNTKGEVVTTIVGLILTLPIFGIVIATIIFLGTKL